MQETSPIEKCLWFPFSDEPLIKAVLPFGRTSNPFLIMPESSCDGRWHLFCDSFPGIRHYVSDSGIVWKNTGIVVFGGSSAHVMRDGENYCLVYEKVFPHTGRQTEEYRKRGFFSRIEMKVSTNLSTWSKPRLLLDAKDVPLASDRSDRPMLHNPQLLNFDGIYRLYFTTSEVKVDDMELPRHLACVASNNVSGPYVTSSDATPLMTVMPDDPYMNLSVGRIRIVRSGGTTYAFQCPVFWDLEKNELSSAILILESEDGVSFRRISEKPMLVTAEGGWASGTLRSCDATFKEDEGCWYCWFSAENSAPFYRRREALGLMIGNVPQV